MNRKVQNSGLKYMIFAKNINYKITVVNLQNALSGLLINDQENGFNKIFYVRCRQNFY